MATSYKKTSIKTYPRITEKETSDNIYWKQLEVPITKKEYGAITDIDFSPTEPYNYAVTNSTRVQIYSSQTNQITRTLNRFREVAHCGSFRDDGRLLVAGSDEAQVKLFDTSSGSMLRVFKGHDGPVNVTRFLQDRVRVMSGSNDRSVRVWDVPSEKPLMIYDEHEDYVRCGVSSMASTDIILTGSYDHTVRMFDTRVKGSAMTVDHGYPVESLVMFPHGSIFMSAGGNVIKVWDALAGGRLLATLTNHHKTVTALAFCSKYQRLLSASLDRHVKIYDVASYQVVHTLDYPGAILSLAVAPDDSLLVVGMADGLLSIKKRKKDEGEVLVKKKKKASFRYTLAGKTHMPHQGDLVVEHKRREHLAKYDVYFRKFQYSKALDAAFNPKLTLFNRPEITVSVIQELIRRGALRAALAGRPHSYLKIIMKFIRRHITDQRFAHTLTDVANLLIDLYSDQIGQGTELDHQLGQLKEVLGYEMLYMKDLLELMGAMDTLFSAATPLAAPSNDTATTPNIDLTPSTLAQAV
ncbi:U3 small nucleolar RNA-associated protein 15 homolog [Haliotis cracherodii]|uniref:U3 small nucleolar RNA-associated protein 15 homolog n=1 Tax=Haliotis cracherodii TaxID=6455 RepID=UPI0039E95FC2